MSIADQRVAASSLPRRIPLGVRLSPQFVNRLCGRVQKTGPEQAQMAGLLFGIAGESLIIVQAFRSFTGADSNGAALDGPRLAQALERSFIASQTDPEVSALDVIGWYALRPAGGLHGRDVEFHNAHFPSPNDLAIILRQQGDNDVLLELYTKAKTGPLSPEEHRWGALRLATDVPALGPIEVTMRTTGGGEELESFESLDRALDNGQRKTGLRARIPLVLRPKRTAEHAPSETGNSAPSPALDPAIPRSAQPSIVRERPAASHAARPVHPIKAGDPPGLPVLFTPPKPRSPWFPSAVLFAVVAGATFAILFIHGLPPGSAMPAFLRAILPDSGLGLHVQTQGDRVMLSWNRRNSVVRSATQGILHIDDGSQHRDFTLNAGQAENGAVLYRPKSDDVTFRLEVRNQQGAAATETIRVLDGAGNTPLDLSAAADVPQQPASEVPVKPPEHHDWKAVTETTAAVPPPARSRQEPSAGSLAEPVILVADAPPKRTAASPAATPSVSTVPRDAVPLPAAETPFLAASATNSKPPEGVPPASPIDTIPAAAPPVNTTAAPLSTAPAQRTADASRDAPAPVAQTPAKQTDLPAKFGSQDLPPTKPATDSGNLKPADARSTGPVQNAPSPQTANPAQPVLGMGHDGLPARDFVAPHPIRQVLPDTTLFPPVFMASSPEVEVTVKVDKDGRVTEAHVVSGRKKVKEALVGAALVAAKQWSFEPAKLHGQPVASEHTIIFQFHPQQ